MIHLLLAIIYLSFISLGLPDCMLGAAWPTMYREFSVPLSYAGIISMIIAFGTIVSSLLSDRLTLKLGTGRVTAISVGLTAFALLGFSFSHSFPLLCILAIPYGLGAGSVDASLNNYVALHYASKHMSWLHCMWGIGAALGPYVMGHVLAAGQSWNRGYQLIGMLQVALTIILFLSLPLWKTRPDAISSKENGISSAEADSSPRREPLSLKQILAIPGAKQIMVAFFCYCGIEQTSMLWSASYLVIHVGLNTQDAARLAGLFAIGITAGRAVSGFMTMRFSDTAMIRIGQAVILTGCLVLLLPFGVYSAVGGLILVGLGCAPVYPCIIHSTPEHFGADLSQAVIGVQMASAYIGILMLPPLFGFLAQQFSAALLPLYLMIILLLMFFMHEKLVAVKK